MTIPQVGGPETASANGQAHPHSQRLRFREPKRLSSFEQKSPGGSLVRRIRLVSDVIRTCRKLDRRPQLRQCCSAVPVVPAAGVFRRIERARRAWFAPADFRFPRPYPCSPTLTLSAAPNPDAICHAPATSAPNPDAICCTLDGPGAKSGMFRHPGGESGRYLRGFCGPGGRS